jgi:hypothetical protein
LTASAGYGRAERLSVFREHLSKFLGCLCSSASAGYGRAERLSVFREHLDEFEEHLSKFLGCLCSTASAGYGRAERLYEFFERLSRFLATLSLFRAVLDKTSLTPCFLLAVRRGWCAGLALRAKSGLAWRPGRFTLVPALLARLRQSLEQSAKPPQDRRVTVAFAIVHSCALQVAPVHSVLDAQSCAPTAVWHGPG